MGDTLIQTVLQYGTVNFVLFLEAGEEDDGFLTS